MKLLLTTVLLSLCCGQALATEAANKDYQKRLERLNKRYEGFFLHKRDQNRYEVRRKAGIPDVKASRKAYEQRRENARKNFVRQPPKDMEPLRIQWEAKQKRLEKKREASRKRFAKQRQRLNQIKNSAKKIPAKEELGIESQ